MSNGELNEKLIAKLQKLMALADKSRNPNEAEADAAMAKVQELMAENNLSMAVLEASGGEAEKRGKEELQKQAQYRYQQELMSALCEVNYCYCEVIWGSAESFYSSRRYGKGYRIIGRESNVIAVKWMFDYLMKTINRLVIEANGGDHRKRMSRWSMSWCDGCAERLIMRLKLRHEETLKKQKEEVEQKRKEEAARSRHPGAAPTSSGTDLMIILEDHQQNEHDYNTDVRYGYPLGTTAAKRREREAKIAAELAKAKAEGVTNKDVLDYIELGYSLARSLELVESSKRYYREYQERQAKQKPETEAQRRKRQEREERENDRYWRRRAREESKRDYGGYTAGKKAGDSISLNQQLGSKTDRRIK